MRVLKIDVTKINKDCLFQGKKKDDGTPGSKYLDCVLNDYKDGPNERNEVGMVVQSVSAELRAKGIKGPIIGNYRDIVTGNSQPAPAARPAATKVASRPAPAAQPDFDDSVPF